ncbi:MAG: dihydrofolate reductase family protein [Polaromonas sp.]
MKKIIAALNTTLDGFIEGAQGEIDWMESWEDEEDTTPQFDTCLLGAGMYPGYEQYWTAVRSAPDKPLPFTGALATPGEQAYAQFAYAIPHIVLSTQMQSAAWPHTQIIRSTADIAKLKQGSGKAIYAVGGAALVGTLINAGLLDEVRMQIRPILLGGGKALFKDVVGRHHLQLKSTRTFANGMVSLHYAV